MDKIKEMFTDLKDTTEKYSKKDIEAGKAMSVLAYIGPLCLVPYFAEKKNKYVRFHAIQGLNIFLASVIYGLAFGALSILLIFVPIIGWFLLLVLGFLSYGFIALDIWGIVNAFQDKAKEVPVVNKIKLIKE
jgi:uncharacterized membrane protein